MAIRYVMPWLAVRPSDVTLLTSPDRLLAKVIRPEGIRDYDNAAVFEPDAVRLEGVDDLAVLLADLAPRSRTCVIRGVLKREFAGRPLVLRRYRPRPDTPERFAPAARAWLMVDADGLPTPGGVDPTDPLRVGGALRRALSTPFRSARAVIQLSSTAG
ncbi:MAG: hypothetical protein K0R41_1301, partial [Geminicoccaceae bacterium]|nr:hypothetical protein [Geminicoccaceae bacterium]